MNDISVILNVYNRPDTLEKQIYSILNQSININPKNIHVWFNKGEKNQFKPLNSEIKTYNCNWNTKFFGRFTIPLLCNTKYVAMFDDDILPQVDWFKIVLNRWKNKKVFMVELVLLLKMENIIHMLRLDGMENIVMLLKKLI